MTKKIKQIKENYSKELNKINSASPDELGVLSRIGLFEENKIHLLRHALSKEPKNLTIYERRMLMGLVDSLIAEVSQPVNSLNLNETAKVFDGYLSKFDPREKPTTDKDIPMVLMLKRKAIRVFPDRQKVALYYAQAIDKYVSIPFSGINVGLSEEVTANFGKQFSVKPKKSIKTSKKNKQQDDDETEEEKTIRLLLKKNKEHESKKPRKIKDYESIPLSSIDDPKYAELRSKIRKHAVLNALGSGSGEEAAGLIGFAAGSKARDIVKSIGRKIKPEVKSVPKPLDTGKKTVTGKMIKPITIDNPSVEYPKNEPRSEPTLKDLSYKKTFSQKINEKRMERLHENAAKDFTYDDLDDTSLKSVAKDLAPGIGTLRDVERTKRAWKRGEYLSALGHGAMAGLSAASDAALASGIGSAVGATGKGIRGAIGGGKVALGLAKGAKAADAISDVAKAGKAADAISDAAKASKVVTVPSVAGKASKAVEVGTDVAKAGKAAKAGKVKAKGSKLGRLAAGTAGIAGALAGNGEGEVGSYSTPKEFSYKAKTTGPNTDSTPVASDAARKETERNRYMQSLKEGAMKKASAIAQSISSGDSKHIYFEPGKFGFHAHLTGPSSNASSHIHRTVQDELTRQLNYNMMKQQESVVSQLNTIKENVEGEYILNIDDNNSIVVSNNIAKKVLHVYETLNEENKKIMNTMLNENVDSCKKIINFALRQ